jgi:hypothetical protein
MHNMHTPGPWISFRDDESHDIVTPDGTHIARVEPVNSVDPLTEQDANGAILAAAPDMLAALRLAADALTPPRNAEESTALDAVLGAIDAATLAH